MKLKHIFWLILRTLTQIGLGIFLFVAWLTLTTSGLKASLSVFNRFSDYHFHPQSIYGCLATGFSAKQITLTPKAAGELPEFHLGSLQVTPHWLDLIQHKNPCFALKIEDGKVFSSYLDQAQINSQEMALNIDGALHYQPAKAEVQLQLSGHWQNTPLTGQMQFSIQNEALQIDSIDIIQAENHFLFQPNASQGYQLLLDAHALDALTPLLTGQLKLTAELDSLIEPQAILLSLNVPTLTIDDLKLDQLKGTFNYQAKQKQQLKATLEIAALNKQQLASKQHGFQLTGSLEKYDFSYHGQWLSQHVKLQGQGQHPAMERFEWTLKQFDITHPKQPRWHLSQPAKIIWQPAEYNMQFDLINAEKSQCFISLQDLGNQQQAKLSLQQIPLRTLHDFGVMEFSLPGTFNLNLTAHANQHQLQTAKALITLQNKRVSCQSKACLADQWMQFEQGEIKAQLQDGKLNSDFQLRVNADNHVKGQLQVHQFLQEVPLEEQTLSGQVDATVNDLSLLMHWLPDIARFRGELDAHATLGGHLLKPELDANAHFAHGTMTLPRFGIKVKPLTLDMHSDRKGILYIQGHGQMRDAPGEFTLTGSLHPFAEGFPNRIVLRSEKTQWANTPAFQFIASPTLAFEFPNFDSLKITGDVFLDQGKINLDAYQENQTCVSEDVVIVSKQGMKRTASDFKVYPEIHIRTKNLIDLQGQNLHASVSGNLLVTQKKGKLLGEGRVTVKQGTYHLPGETLTIQRGRLTYLPGTLLTDPVLDIRLMRTGDHYKPNDQQNNAGIYILGPLSEMEIENMGWLEGHSSDTFSRALSLSSSQLINPLQKKLKLDKVFDNVGVASVDRYGQDKQGDIEQANVAFVVGKRISDRIYAQVMKSFLDNDANNEPVEKARLNIELTQNAALGFEISPKGQGVDLSFSIEKD